MPARIKFTQNQIQNIIKLYQEDKETTVSISKKYNCDNKKINRLLKKNNIELRRQKKTKINFDKDGEYIANLYKNTQLTTDEISEKLNCSPSKLRKFLKSKLSKSEYPRRISVNIIDLVQDYKSGLNYKLIEEKYNMSDTKMMTILEQYFSKDQLLALKKKRKLNQDNKRQIENNLRKEKRLDDPEYKKMLIFKRLHSTFSRNFRGPLKRAKLTKNYVSCFKLVGYTKLDLYNHIESLFEPWMNWENWGVYDPKTWNDNDQSTWTWHLDHIIPSSHLPYYSFEDENFKRCWSLQNLRPYSAKQNILDGNRR